MNKPELMARVQFATPEARERAEGIMSYTGHIVPTGGRSWIIPVDQLPRTLRELAADGFTPNATVKVD